MADRRRVSVNLELEIARYIGPATQAAAATRRVSSSIDDLGDEVDATGRDMQQLAANTDIAAHQVDDLGDEARMTTAELMLLERQLHSTGRAARGMDVDGAGGGIGRRAIKVTSKFDMSDFPRLRTTLITTLVSGAVMASPILGAMIAGAITGAVGVGGIAGGIAMASKDARVRAAARQFGDDISDEFFSGGKAFVGPTIESLGLLSQAFKDMDLGDSFARLAPHVTTLADGLGDMMRNIMPGLNQAFDRMGPFVDVMANGFGDLGTQLGDFFNRVSRSEGAIMGLESLFHFLNGAIKILGVTIEFLSNRYKEFIDFIIFTSGVFEDIPLLPFADTMRDINDAFTRMREHADRVPPSVNQVGGAIESFGAAASLTASALGHLGGALSEAHQEFLDFADAEIGAEEALDRMQETLDASNGSLDQHTEKGRAARQAVIDFARASALAAEKKAIESQSVRAAERIYESYRKQLVDTLITTGKTRKEAERLANEWMGLDKLADIRKTITITTIRRQQDELHRAGERSTSGRAAGGSVLMDRVYKINEQVPEVFFRAPANGTVMPLSQMRSATQTSRASAGARPFNVTVSGLSRHFQEDFDEIVREVGRRGGTLAVIGVQG